VSAVRSSRRASAGPRIGRRFLALLAVACVAGISATAALAWSQYYEQNTSFSAGDLRTSAYNSGVDQNKVNFSNIFGGLPQMELALYLAADRRIRGRGRIPARSKTTGVFRTARHNVWRIPVTDTPYTSVSAGQPTFEIAIT